MKNTIFTVCVLIMVAVGISLLMPRETIWMNPFARNHMDGLSTAPPVSDNSIPALFDRLLFEGRLTEAMNLLSENNLVVSKSTNPEAPLALVSKKTSRDSLVVSVRDKRQGEHSIVAFYSFDMEMNGQRLPTRQRLAVEWSSSKDKWFASKSISTSPTIQ